MVRTCIFLSLLFTLSFCTPQGPQTFNSNLIGHNKEQLLKVKGQPNKIQIFDSSEAYIYIKKEAYYGKNIKPPLPEKPKRIYEIEFIYYINSHDLIYKHQIWKKKIK